MRILIAEDDHTSCQLMVNFLSRVGDCTQARDGRRAVDAFRKALDADKPFDLVCLDIMMPNMNGREALDEIRKIEAQHGILGLDGVKIIMTTALDDSKTIFSSFRQGCEAYLIKPIAKQKLYDQLEKLDLIKASTH